MFLMMGNAGFKSSTVVLLLQGPRGSPQEQSPQLAAALLGKERLRPLQAELRRSGHGTKKPKGIV